MCSHTRHKETTYTTILPPSSALKKIHNRTMQNHKTTLFSSHSLSPLTTTSSTTLHTNTIKNTKQQRDFLLDLISVEMYTYQEGHSKKKTTTRTTTTTTTTTSTIRVCLLQKEIIITHTNTPHIHAFFSGAWAYR